MALGVKTPIRTVAVMYRQLCILIRLRLVQNGVTYLRVNRKS